MLKKIRKGDCDEDVIIPDQQFGCRRFHSTVYAVTPFESDCCWSLNAKEFIEACQIDLENAFDTVWQAGLKYKLIKFDFPVNIFFESSPI